jgi:hypothetical protein
MKVKNPCRVTVRDFSPFGKPPFFLDSGLRLGKNAEVERDSQSDFIS